jgi:hypothetical protein
MGYNISLPIDADGNLPKGQELHDLIMSHAPIGYLQEQVDRFYASTLADFSYIDRLILSGEMAVEPDELS